MVRACDQDLEKVMKMLDFKYNKLYIKHLDILINYESYMPEKVQELFQVSTQKRLQKIQARKEEESISLTAKQRMKQRMSSYMARERNQHTISHSINKPGDFSLCSNMQEFRLNDFVKAFEQVSHKAK